MAAGLPGGSGFHAGRAGSGRPVVRQVRATEREPGQLSARPERRRVPEPPAATGLLPLGLDGRRDGVLYVPTTYRAGQAAPLSVKLHGAGGHARAGLEPFLERADAAGLLLLGIDSRGPTWDLIQRSGPAGARRPAAGRGVEPPPPSYAS